MDAAPHSASNDSPVSHLQSRNTRSGICETQRSRRPHLRDEAGGQLPHVATDKGTECAVALPRTERLSNGAVFALKSDRAMVVRMSQEGWLAITASDDASALQLQTGPTEWQDPCMTRQISCGLYRDLGQWYDYEQPGKANREISVWRTRAPKLT